MDEFERRVMGEIGRLEGPEFPRGRRAERQRVETCLLYTSPSPRD